MVMAMPASEYIRFLKSAQILFAEKRLTDIETASFPHFQKNEQRDEVIRGLTKVTKGFIFEGVADFATFAANFAKRMNHSG